MNDMPDVRQALHAYRQGLFPMAAGRDAVSYDWYWAPVRSLLPIRNLHVPRRLKRLALRAPFDVRIDTDFAGVIDGCAAPRDKQPETWINQGLRRLLLALHEAGYAHSVECWRDGLLAGGLYGIAVGQVFCGESMFSVVDNASKIALIHLCARLDEGGFRLLDSQYQNPHLLQFGAYEMDGHDYVENLLLLADHGADFGLQGSRHRNETERIRKFLMNSD